MTDTSEFVKFAEMDLSALQTFGVTVVSYSLKTKRWNLTYETGKKPYYTWQPTPTARISRKTLDGCIQAFIDKLGETQDARIKKLRDEADTARKRSSELEQEAIELDKMAETVKQTTP